MSEKEQFQITLVSNTKGVDGTTNTPDKFAIKVPVKRKLDGEWEVALMEIQYPAGGKTIEEDIDLGFVFTAPPEIVLERKKEEDEFDTHLYDNFISMNGIMADQTTEELQQLSEAQKAHLKVRPYGSFTHLSRSTGYARARFPRGNCQSLEKFIQILNEKVEQAYTFICKNTAQKDKPTQKLHFQYDPETDRVSCPKHTWDVNIYSRGFYLPRIVGFSSYLADNAGMTKILTDKGATRAPIFELLPSIFIYSNIIEYQIVGDTLTPLLVIVPVKGGPLEQTHWTFSPPYYIPVRAADMDIIGIQLKSDSGDPYPLAASAKVVVRLHFRRRRQLL